MKTAVDPDHQGRSALSSTAFPGLQTLSWETGSFSVAVICSERGDITHSGWEGCSSLAEFQLQAGRGHNHNFSLSLLPGLPAVSDFVSRGRQKLLKCLLAKPLLFLLHLCSSPGWMLEYGRVPPHSMTTLWTMGLYPSACLVLILAASRSHE